jgi:4-amino-4-deoxy-L-arabinose transferase-like glycosyltransferase
MNSKKEFFILLIIFIIALFLRIWQLAKIPTGIHGDEASIGYNAYSLLKTAKDQNGNFLPLTIDQFGDYRPAGYHYLDIPFVAIFGLNELAVRLPSAIFGALTVIIFFLLLLELWQNKLISFLGAGLLAITPWHINISRSTSEGVIAALFIILALYFLLKGAKDNKNSFIFCAVIFFLISAFFYHSARFFVPAILPFVILISLYEYKSKNRRFIIFSSLLLYLGIILLMKYSHGSARPLNISIFNIPGGDKLIHQQIAEDGHQKPLITRFFHNKLIFYSRVFLSSYSLHFSGEFLFNNTGLPIRYRVPWSGNLYIIYLPFILVGFSKLLIDGLEKKKYLFFIPIIWLFLAGMPAGLTYEDIPNIQRSSLMIYPFLMLTAFGFWEVFSLLKNKIKVKIIFLLLTGAFLFRNSLYFLHNYFHHSPINEPWYRSAAVKELIFSLQEISKNYDKVIMTTSGDNHLIHYLFYQKFDPKLFQKLGSPKEHDGLVFQNIVYVHNPCPLEGNSKIKSNSQPETLFVNHANCSNIPQNAQIIKTILHPDGTPAFNVIKLE